MARRKNMPESVRVKCHLSERLREVRIELHGERGGSGNGATFVATDSYLVQL